MLDNDFLLFYIAGVLTGMSLATFGYMIHNLVCLVRYRRAQRRTT